MGIGRTLSRYQLSGRGGKEMKQKTVFRSKSTLACAIRLNGLPVTLEAAGSGLRVEITETSGLSKKAHDILDTAALFGNGVVIDEK